RETPHVAASASEPKGVESARWRSPLLACHAFFFTLFSVSSSAPLLYESHCHTPLCKHAIGMPVEYAAAALERNLKGIIFTCHCPLPDIAPNYTRMDPAQYEDYVALVADAREKFAGRVDVRLGLESDYYPGV